MIKSIRRFLIINLLLAIAIATTLTVLGNYYLDQKDIHKHMDTLMGLSTLTFEALLGQDAQNRNLNQIQNDLNQVPIWAEKVFKVHLPEYEKKHLASKVQLQVLDKNNKLLLHSAYASKLPISDLSPGFSSKQFNDDDWRLFTSINPKTGIKTVVSEQSDTRYELIHRIALDDLYIMLIMFPVLGLLIWIIIGKGLKSLKRATDEVSHRAPSYLEPVGIHDLPVEVKPLIVELNKLFLRLDQALEREKRFSADAAHELKTPLAALKTHAQVAVKTDDPKERQQALSQLIAGVDRSSHVVQQLLTLSRLVPTATQIDESSQVNMSKLTAEVIAQLAPTAINKNIDIELNTPDKDAILFGNVTALSVLIRNLVDNAIRYTPEGGAVTVSVNIQDDHVILTVIDNGPGIPAELRSRVFERFFRVLGTDSPGSGLGLAIVSQIAKLHHATVSLGARADGTGLEVEVNFPRVP